MDREEHLRTVVAALIQDGLDSKDVAVAAHLSWYILTLDEAVFPDTPVPVSLEEGTHQDDMTQYRWSSTGAEEYVVYVPGLYEQMRAECIATVMDATYLVGSREHPIPTLREAIIGISVHEVRHRLQFMQRDTLCRWKPDMQRECFIGSVLRQVQASGRWQKAARNVPGLPGPYEELEFDARVIQLYALHRTDILDDTEALADIVRLEP